MFVSAYANAVAIAAGPLPGAFQLNEPAQIQTMSVETLSEADKLNGLQWFGEVHILTKAFCVTHQWLNGAPSGWSNWLDPELAFTKQRA